MGDFELITSLITFFLLNSIVYIIFGTISFIDFFFKRYGLLKHRKSDMYECGIRPKYARPINFSLSYVRLCVLYCIYDIEFIFLFPFMANIQYIAFFEILIFIYIFILLILSILIDKDKNFLYFQY